MQKSENRANVQLSISYDKVHGIYGIYSKFRCNIKKTVIARIIYTTELLAIAIFPCNKNKLKQSVQFMKVYLLFYDNV